MALIAISIVLGLCIFAVLWTWLTAEVTDDTDIALWICFLCAISCMALGGYLSFLAGLSSTL